MSLKVPRIWTKILLVVLVVIFQLLSTRISFIYKQNVSNLEFGLKNGTITFLMEFLILLSGFALALVPDRLPDESKKVNIAFLLLFIFSLLIVIVRILMYGFGLFQLLNHDLFDAFFSPFNTFGTWTTTQFPSFLAGFSLRYLFRR
jgi:hypothetical protein